MKITRRLQTDKKSVNFYFSPPPTFIVHNAIIKLKGYNFVVIELDKSDHIDVYTFLDNLHNDILRDITPLIPSHISNSENSLDINHIFSDTQTPGKFTIRCSLPHGKIFNSEKLHQCSLSIKNVWVKTVTLFINKTTNTLGYHIYIV